MVWDANRVPGNGDHGAADGLGTARFTLLGAEHIAVQVLHDPDIHIGALDCLRPGAASMYRAAAQAAEQEKQFQEGV